MTEEEIASPIASRDEEILQQQYLRAMSSFEGILLGQMKVKTKLGDRLNYSIRAGLVILGLIALSILVLLLTLSSQVNRISGVVSDMNSNFIQISRKMDNVRQHILGMDAQVALMADIEQYTTIMVAEMDGISSDINSMESSVMHINEQFNSMSHVIGSISSSIHLMNSEVQQMNYEMNRMSKPARTMNSFIPIIP